MKELKMILQKLDVDGSCDKDELKSLILDMRAKFKNSSSSANMQIILNKEVPILHTPPNLPKFLNGQSSNSKKI